MSTLTLSLCETATAGPLTPNHIRVVGPDGLKTGGGLRRMALCGRDLGGGWDLRVADAAEIRRLATTDNGLGQVWVCTACSAEALLMLGASS